MMLRFSGRNLAIALSLFFSAFVPPRAYSADSELAKELSGYRTVKDAKTTTVSRTSDRTNATGYLGVSVAWNDGDIVVEEVSQDSPAEKALQQGDVISQLDGTKLEDISQFRELMAAKKAGDKLDLIIQRDSEEIEKQIELAALSRPMSRSSRARRGYLGVQVEPAKSGVRIRSVVSDSGAEKAGLRAGDVVVSIDGRDVGTSTRLVQLLSRRGPGEVVKLQFVRGEDDAADVEVELQGAFGGTRSNNKPYEKGQYKLAIIPIEYPDQKHNAKVALDDWNESLFSEGSYNGRNATGQRVYGSLNDYYREVSNGQFGVQGKVFDWVEVSKKRRDYLEGSRNALLNEAVEKLLERDGKDALDSYQGIFFLYAGARVRVSRGELYWPHRGSFTFKRKRWPYFIMQEGGERMSGISVMCHEFGHMLGLPDLYSRDSRAEGLGVWCAMSNQAGNGRPQHFSVWCKEQLGWVKPTVIDPSVKQKLILGPIERSSQECYKVLVRADGSEYLLLENRRQFGFDASLPSQGLLIWRVINNRPVLEESHGVAGPAGPGSFREAVPFPSEANNAFTPLTTPSSRSPSGGGSEVHITNIRQLSDGRISFYVGYEFQ